MHQLTTISQLGSRKSICELHVNKLIENSFPGTKHIFYIVDDKNPILNKYADLELSKIGKVFYRKDNLMLLNRHKTLSALGGDKNYEWLISHVETPYFLTLHDDSIILNNKVFKWIKKNISDSVSFGGFTDGRAQKMYDTLYYKNTKMSKLRIGTWFLFGNTNEFILNKMKMGFYRNVYFFNIKRKLNSPNVRTTKFKQWVNGGFPFNITIRDLDYKLAVEQYDENFKFKKSIIHKEKVTGFFVARKLINYVDTCEEINKWLAYWNEISYEQKIHDMKFLKNLKSFLSEFKIYDKNLNELCNKLKF